FGPDNAAEDMDAYCAGAYSVEKMASELVDPDREVLLAMRAGEIVGYAQLRAGPAPECVGGPEPIEPIEIVRFYIDGRWHGRGLAAALMAQTLAAAERRGASTVYLAVWERNDKAIAFYRKHGFVKVGAKPFVLGRDVQTDEVMVRRSPA